MFSRTAILLSLATLGLVHATILDTVRSRPELSTLAGLLSSPAYARIAQVLSTAGAERTLLAPTNDAFAALGANFDPRNVRVVSAQLLYHILPSRLTTQQLTARGHSFVPTLMNDAAFVNIGSGRSQVVQIENRGGLKVIFGMPRNDTWEAGVVTPDIAASNGIVHVISKVLLIPRGATDAAGLGGLQQLIVNLQQAGTLEIAENSPALTIFAPTNTAFDEFQRLLNAKPSIDRADVMKQHIVSQLLYSPQLSGGQTLRTMNGKPLKVEKTGGRLSVNGVAVTSSDVLIKNGVVHIIEKVIGIDKL